MTHKTHGFFIKQIRSQSDQTENNYCLILLGGGGCLPKTVKLGHWPLDVSHELVESHSHAFIDLGFEA